MGRRDITRFACQQFKFIWRGESAGMLRHIEDRALGLVAGHRADEMSQMVIDVYAEYIEPKLWPETVRIAQEHVAKGREVWIITASPMEMAEHIAEQLGLTGGLGTLDELLEVMAWRQLGCIDKPIALLNTAGYFDPWIGVLRQAVKEGFLDQAEVSRLMVHDRVDRLLEALEENLPLVAAP